MSETISAKAWTWEHAAHLYRRAGFGASPAELEAASKLSPEELVHQLVNYESLPFETPPPAWLTPTSSQRPGKKARKELSKEEKQAKRKEQQQNMQDLRMWWLNRMLHSPRPLEEKLTLFWHGHFATSEEKVHSSYAMYLQNQMFRRLASAGWHELVLAVAQDPAMLLYLDNAQSRPKAPNENFARELMELFTLGEGRYTEPDIKAAAQAFVGWTLEEEAFVFVDRKRMHVHANKVFMKHSGDLNGDDIIRIILDQPEASDFIVAKLWSFFAYEDPEHGVIKSLSKAFRESGQQLKPLLTQMFLRPEFYSKKAMRTQIKSPVQWLVGSLHALESGPPPEQITTRILKELGQTLFAPPNVKGWVGGYTWITPATLIDRNNLAERFGEGEHPSSEQGQQKQPSGRLPLSKHYTLDSILPKAVRSSRDVARQSLQRRLFQSELTPDDVKGFDDEMKQLPPPDEWTLKELGHMVSVMMSSSQYQLV